MPKVSGKDAVDELTSLYDGEVGAVYKFVLRRCGANVALSEDITQEAFLAATSTECSRCSPRGHHR